jgi:excisionase family DNA binding protein
MKWQGCQSIPYDAPNGSHVNSLAGLGGVHPKTVERWARQGRIPAYRFFKRWSFRASELEVWMRSHVNSTCHPCRLKQEESDGT